MSPPCLPSATNPAVGGVVSTVKAEDVVNVDKPAPLIAFNNLKKNYPHINTKYRNILTVIFQCSYLTKLPNSCMIV